MRCNLLERIFGRQPSSPSACCYPENDENAIVDLIVVKRINDWLPLLGSLNIFSNILGANE